MPFKAATNGGAQAGTGEALNGTVQDRQSLGGLERRRCRLVGLRVVTDNQRWANRATIWSHMQRATDVAGDATDADDRTGAPAAGNGRENNFVHRPADSRGHAVIPLAVTAAGLAFQTTDRIDGLWVIAQEQFIAGQVVFDVGQQGQRGLLRAGYEINKRVPTRENRPHHGHQAERRLAAAARHGDGERFVIAHDALDFGNDAKMVLRPRQREQVREVRFAVEAEITVGPRSAHDVPHRRQGCNVLAVQRDSGAAGFGLQLFPLIRPRVCACG